MSKAFWNRLDLGSLFRIHLVLIALLVALFTSLCLFSLAQFRIPFRFSHLRHLAMIRVHFDTGVGRDPLHRAPVRPVHDADAELRLHAERVPLGVQ